MQHTRTWSDVYGSALACFEGRAGGHAWLVASPPELAGSLAGALDRVDGKGNVTLLVHDGLTPLLALGRDLQPRGVLVVAAQALGSGPPVTVPPRRVDDSGGVDYAEGGDFPAWAGADAAAAGEGECAPASVAASLGLPVVVTAPEGVRAALEAWMERTPHGR